MHSVVIFLRESFYGPGRYAEVRQQNFLSAVWYALLAGFIGSAVFSVFLVQGTFEILKLDMSPEAVSKIYPPGLEIHIKNGQVSTNQPEPYLLSFPNFSDATSSSTSSPKYLLMVDTTKDLALEDIRAVDALVVLGKSSLYAVKDASEMRIFSLKDVQSFDLTEVVVNDFIRLMRPLILLFVFLLPVLMLLFGTIFSALYYLVVGVLGACIVLVVSRVGGMKLKFGEAYVVALFASIPMSILSAVLFVFGVTSSFILGLVLLAGLAYLNLSPAPISADPV